MQVGADIVRLGRRGVIDVAADVAVPVLGLDLADGHEAGVAVHILPLAIDVDDFADVLGAEEVLRLALAVFAVGIDEKDLFPVGSAFLVHHEDAGGNAGAVEQPGRQADDGLQPAALDEVLPRLLFLAAPEEHAMGHDGGHFPVGLQHGDHVLHEHEIGLLPFLRQPDGEAAGILDVLLDVVLGEGRVGEDAVEAAKFAALIGLVLRVAQGVLLADVGVLDAVQEHVHFADGPGGADALLPGEREVTRITTALASRSRGSGSTCRQSRRWGHRCSCPAAGPGSPTMTRTTSAGV